jgi:hypothetical protein
MMAGTARAMVLLSVVITIVGIHSVDEASSEYASHIRGALIFPYAELVDCILGTMYFVSWLGVVIVQYPIYAMLVLVGMIRDSVYKILVTLFCIHTLTAIVCLLLG